MDGLLIGAQYVSWDDLAQFWLCRKCHRGIGLPYADPVTGQLDHSRMVCGHEHEIKSGSDVIHKGLVASLEAREEAAGREVLVHYPWLVKALTGATSDLYGDDDFEGFD